MKRTIAIPGRMKREVVIGSLLGLAAAVAYGVSSVLVKQRLTVVSPLVASTVSLLAGTVMMGALTAVRWESGLAKKRKGIWYFVISGVFAGLGVMTSFFSLSLAPVVVVVPIQNTNPLFTLLWSRLFLGHLEKITGRVILGTILLVGGVVLIAIGRAF